MKTFNDRLSDIIDVKKSLVCVGLDVHPNKLPQHLLQLEDPVFEFNKAIIDATKDVAAAYKPNLAFYEALGTEGWDILKRTVQYIPDDVIVIGDAKRGDIGSTAERYADALHDIGFDAVTLSPYLGIDSIKPFFKYPETGLFILALTSNPSSSDFQYLQVDGKPLYLHVAQKINSWNTHGNCGLVVGATHSHELKEIRDAAPELPFLIPGIGAQGGDLDSAIQLGTDAQGKNALINASRSIIYASSERDFADKARASAIKLRDEIQQARKKKENA